VQILQLQTKGIHLNSVERFYIYKEVSINIYLNDTHAIPNSKIFETIHRGFQETDSIWPLP